MEPSGFFLQLLEREAAANRRVLERVPEGRNSWKPHERSMEMGYLAALVASMPRWIAMMIETDELNLDKPEAQRFRPRAQDSTADLLKLSDESKAAAEIALKNTSEGPLAKAGNSSREASQLRKRLAANKSHISSLHMAHHRGQLTVYLRLNEAKVPAIYGPSADERFS